MVVGPEFEAFGEHKTLAQWAKDDRCIVSVKLLRHRVESQKLDLEEAMTRPTRKQLTAFGETRTYKEWEADERCVVSAHDIQNRVRDLGWDPERAITEPANLEKTYFVDGNWLTINEIAQQTGIPAHRIRRRINDGWEIEKAAKAESQNTPALVTAFGITKNASDWLRDSRCNVRNYTTLKYRLDVGWDPETALTQKENVPHSQGETEVAEYVESLGLTIEQANRTIIPPQEIDIYIPQLNIGIEYNGLHWHSELYKEKNYHRDKNREAAKQGVRLIHVWEDWWTHKPEIVKEMIAAKLGASTRPTVGARQCEIVEPSRSEADDFLNTYHIQGATTATDRIGLRHGNELIAAMTFTRRADGQTELTRYATDRNVPGGFSRLVAAYKPRPLVSFASLDISDGTLYESNGWKLDKELAPDYMYIVGDSRRHKFGYRKARFETDPNLAFREDFTEHQLARLNELYRIYDCGKLRYALY